MKYKDIAVDPRIGQIFDDMIVDNNNSNAKKQFIKKYLSKKPEEIDWIELCDDVELYNCPKFILLFLVSLIKQNLYCGTYKKELQNILNKFTNIIEDNSRLYRVIFCKEKINGLIIYDPCNHKTWKHSYVFINTKNKIIKELAINFLSSKERKYIRWSTPDFFEHFADSFHPYINNIKSYKDLNGNTMFTQLDYYKNLYKNNINAKNNAIKSIIYFYRWAVNYYTEYDFFKNSYNMSTPLLFNSMIFPMIEKNYYFMTFNPFNIPLNKTKVCFLLKNLSNESTMLTSDDWRAYDISSLEDPNYINMIWSFAFSSSYTISLKGCAQITYIIDSLNLISKLKKQKDYPNKNIKYFTNQEAVLIKRNIDSYDIKLSTKNNRIGAIRRFLKYTEENNLIKFDDMFFEYLKQYEEPVFNTAESIPEDELALINNVLLNKAKKDLKSKVIYTIFHLCLQTEFRINQICHLKIDCIKPSVKPNQYVICTNSKTSHGAIEHYTITDITYKLLIDIIEDTEELRDRCNIEKFKDYIFLYSGRANSVKVITDTIFGTFMKNACHEAGLSKVYNASNLRDTHMTKSFEHTLRNKKSDIEMSVLSGHKHIDTTKNHYIEMELEKMLESTYGVIIGEKYIDTDSRVVDEIPKELESEENDVENGCGKCSAKTCVLTSSLPCLACKYFITTVKHENFFKKAIENVDKLIPSTTNQHDKEDLIIIKQLYILYLKSIYKCKEVK